MPCEHCEHSANLRSERRDHAALAGLTVGDAVDGDALGRPAGAVPGQGRALWAQGHKFMLLSYEAQHTPQEQVVAKDTFVRFVRGRVACKLSDFNSKSTSALSKQEEEIAAEENARKRD